MVAVPYLSTFAALALPLLVPGKDSTAWYEPRSPSGVFDALRVQLSHDASIILPGDVLFQTSSSRWTAYSRPSYSAIVEVAGEEDVQATVSTWPTIYYGA
jgi:hypothetical protein